MTDAKPMGPIGLRCNAYMARLHALTRYAQALKERCNGDCYLADELAAISKGLCSSLTEAQRATGYQAEDWPGGK